MSAHSMRLLGFLALALLFSGCVSIKPVTRLKQNRLSRPLFTAAVVEGPIVRDTRLAGTTTSYGSTVVGTSYGFASAGSSGVATHTEAYDNYEYEQLLRYTLEDRIVTKRSYRRGEVRNSDGEIVSRLLRSKPTGNWKQSTWNLINLFTFTWILGTPFRIEHESEVEMRIYQRGQLIGTLTGTGRSRVTSDIYSSTNAFAEAKRESIRLAVQNAVEKLVTFNTPKSYRPASD